jgi:2-methylcitrate dehydratase PrpD
VIFLPVVPSKIVKYITEESYTSGSNQIKQSLKETLADIIACTIAGTKTNVFEIVNKFVRSQYGSGASSIIMTSHKVNATGAALVNATSANALDMDDGHRLVKGHPGAIIFPAVLAASEEYLISGEEFMTSLLIGYEVAIRAGILAHQLRPEYHCTGSWGAIGAAAGVSRVIGLSTNEIHQALGIAEYQSTYSPMMRCIEKPSMLKDGIGWGCMTGISASYLAKEGFSGIPSLFEMEEAVPYLQELGQLYRIDELYYKPYACCRWAQPGIEALRELLEKYDISSVNVNRIKVYTFAESACLSRTHPKNTEEAQYNLTFPIAAYLYSGEVGPHQVLNELDHPEILNIMDKIEVYESEDLNSEFPNKALSKIELEDFEGNLYVSGVHQAKGDYDYPLSAIEKRQKFNSLVEPILGTNRCEDLFNCIQNIEDLKTIRILSEKLSN